MNPVRLTQARARVDQGQTGDVRSMARLVRTLACALVLLCARGAGAAEPPRQSDGVLHEVTTVAPGVWVLAQPRFQPQPAGNVTVIEQSDGLVLVDAGGSPGAARRVTALVRGLSRKPVKAVIVTHWHGDHPQGLAEILATWPKARTIATRATQAHLRNPATMNTPAAPDAERNAALMKQIQGFADYAVRMARAAATAEERAGWEASARLFVQYAADMDGATTLSTAEGFDARLSIPDRRAPVEAKFLGRANTDGDAIVWLPRQKVLVTGDVVVAPVPFGFGSYPAEWLPVLEKLRRHDFRVLVPGHGPPQRDRAYIDRLSAAIADIRDQVGPLAAQGLTLEEVRKRVDAGRQRQRFVGNAPWLSRWFQDYWVSPLVASAYKEARGEPIRQSLGGQ